MKKLITTLCLKLLNWTGYTIPPVPPIPIPIRPNIISPEFGKRAMVQQKIDFHQLQEWTENPNFDFDEHIRRKVQEAMAERLAGDLEVFTLHTPDGLVYRCDVIFKDMSESVANTNANTD